LQVATLVLVTGVPGTGKSLVSRRLSEVFECNAIESSNLFREAGALKADPTGRDSSIVDESIALNVIEGLAGSGEGCFIVSTLYPTLWLDAAYDSIAFIVLLRCDPRVLLRRLEDRGWGRAKVIENVLAEAFNVVAEELLEYEDSVIEVDTSHKSLEATVLEVLGKLESWSTGIRIDWLSLDGELVEFVTRLVHELDLYKERLGV